MNYSNIQQFLTYNPINFLPYTIAPAEAKDNELESFDSAIEYFKSKGITDLVMQEKRMGSNVCMYLFKDKTKDFISTKTGYCRKEIELTNLWRDKVFAIYPNANLVILHGELEPWSYYGKGLIQNTFTKYYVAQKAHIDMEDTSTYNKLWGLSQEANSLGVTKDINKKEFLLNNPSINNRYLEALINSLYVIEYSIPKHIKEELNTKFEVQLDIYGQDKELTFIPFSVLKVDDTVLPLNNYDSWYLFNTRGCYTAKKALYQGWLAFKYDLEGVVIKPRDSHIQDVVPAIKVRNPEFLRLIYGSYYDVQIKEYLLNKKCNRKRASSIKQWQLAYQMLQIPYNKIHSEEHCTLVNKFFNEDRKVRYLDPRL